MSTARPPAGARTAVRSQLSTATKDAAGAPPAVRWVPVPEDAFQSALKLRAQVQKLIRMRPDVSLVIAALLTQPADAQEIAEAVARYGLASYARTPTKVGEEPGPPA